MIEIPQIKTSLPIYHGTDEAVLQVAVGHLEWTSLPTGGKGTHCVVSGHRGLPSAKLFSDLDQLVEGDIFVLRILNEVLTKDQYIKSIDKQTMADKNMKFYYTDTLSEHNSLIERLKSEGLWN